MGCTCDQGVSQKEKELEKYVYLEGRSPRSSPVKSQASVEFRQDMKMNLINPLKAQIIDEVVRMDAPPASGSQLEILDASESEQGKQKPSATKKELRIQTEFTIGAIMDGHMRESYNKEPEQLESFGDENIKLKKEERQGSRYQSAKKCPHQDENPFIEPFDCETCKASQVLTSPPFTKNGASSVHDEQL